MGSQVRALERGGPSVGISGRPGGGHGEQGVAQQGLGGLSAETGVESVLSGSIKAN